MCECLRRDTIFRSNFSRAEDFDLSPKTTKKKAERKNNSRSQVGDPMKVTHAIAVPVVRESDGSCTVSGWVKAPKDSRVLVRFETEGPLELEIDGLRRTEHGWYKYLPCTGGWEFFEVSGIFPEEIHGSCLPVVELWKGNDGFEIVHDYCVGKNKVLFWGPRENFKRLARLIDRPVEYIGLAGGLGSAFGVRNNSLLKDKRIASLSAQSRKDLLKDYEITLGTADGGSILIDAAMMSATMIGEDGRYIELSPEIIAAGLLPKDATILRPGQQAHTNQILASIDYVACANRPYKTAILEFEDHRNENSSKSYLKTAAIGDGKPLDSWIVQSGKTATEDLQSFLNSSNRIMQDKFVAVQPRPKSEQVDLCEQPIVLSSPYVFDLPFALQEIDIETWIVSPPEAGDRSLLLTLELIDENSEPISIDQEVPGVHRSKLEQVGFFRYINLGDGYKNWNLNIQLPSGIRCTKIGFFQFRKISPAPILVHAKIHFQLN